MFLRCSMGRSSGMTGSNTKYGIWPVVDKTLATYSSIITVSYSFSVIHPNVPRGTLLFINNLFSKSIISRLFQKKQPGMLPSLLSSLYRFTKCSTWNILICRRFSFSKQPRATSRRIFSTETIVIFKSPATLARFTKCSTWNICLHLEYALRKTFVNIFPYLFINNPLYHTAFLKKPLANSNACLFFN